jgi:hypothetical protein
LEIIFPIFISKNLSSFSRWVIIVCFFFNITYFSWADTNESGFADSNTFDLDTTDTGTGGHSGFADSNTFPLDTTDTGTGGHSGFADSNAFPLDTTDTGTGGYSGFADSNTFPLDTTDTGTGGHSGFADSNAFPLDTTDTGTGGYSGFADSNTFPLDTTDTGTGGHSGFADSNAFPLDTTDTGTGGYSGFADSNTFPLDTTDTGTGGHSGFADSNAFPLDTTDTGTGGYSGFADSNTFPLDTTDTGTGGHSGFADSNAFPLNTTDTGTGGHSGFADSNEFALDTTSDEQNATIYGTVSYVGIIPGPAIVWALDANETVIDQDILSDGNGPYSLTVPIGQGYDFKVFIDGTGDGQPQAYEVWKYHGDWNSSLGKFNLTQVDGNLSGINFNLFDSDYDSDGFTNWQEHQAGSNQNDFNSTPPLEFGLLAHWTFDETNGTVLHDSSGNDLNGTLVGFNNPWSPGRKSGSLRFDGIDDHVTFAGITELNDIRPLSFSGWLKLDHNGSGYVFAKRSQGQGYWRLFASGPSKNWLVRSTTASAPTLQTYEVTPFFHWQHVSLTWNGLLNGQNTKLYIDGSEELSITRNVGSGQIISDADNQFTLGNRPQNNSSFFKGWMDDFRVWNRVITQNEIQALYQGAPVTYATISGNITNTTSVPGPIILWVYDESGTKVAQQTLPDGPGPFTFSLPAGHSYDIKAFADGNQDGELNPSIGEPYTHFGNWNGNGHDLLPVDGNQSNVNLTLNYETDQDNDGFSLWTETQAGSDDNNSDSIPNNPPADLNSTAPLNFAENLPIGSVIGEFNATDPDANSTLAYYFVPGDNNNTFFTLEQNGTLKTASIFDFEFNASNYLLQISVTDEYNSTVEGNFTVSLMDAAENLAPLNLTASNSYFDENIPVGNQITSINASDPEGAPLSFSLVSGLGDTHNHLFTLDTQSGWGGGTYGSLKIAVPFNFETNASTYSVRVEAKDDHNASVSQDFILTLNDINEAPLDLNISNHSIAELTDLTKIHTLNKNITVQNEIINGLLFLEEQDNHFSNIGNSLSRLGELTALHQDILKSQFDRDNYSNEFNQIRDQIGQLSTITYNGENLFTTSPANPYPIEFHLTEDGADANLSSQYAISELKLLNGDASYRYYISINGVDLSSGSIPFNSDLNTTVNDIANAINADSNLSAIVAASKISHSAGIQLIAATPRAAFHVDVQSVGVAQDMEWTTYFLQQQDDILQTIGQIINRMAELKSLTSDPLANQSTIDGAAAEFTGLQSQLSHLRNVKFDTFDLFTTSTSDGNLSFYTTIDGPNPPLSEKVHEVTLDSNLLSSANSIRINGKTISINGLGLSVVAQAINTNSDINSSVHASHSAEDATVVLSSLIPSVIFSCELLDMIGNSIPSGNLTTNIPTEITLNRLNVFEDGTPGKGLISINGYDLTDSSLNPGNGGSLDDYGTADFTNMLETIGSAREINAAYSLYTQIIRSELNSTIGPDTLLDWKHAPSILGITRLNIFEDGEPGDGLKNYIGSLITDLNITTYTHDDGELFTNNLVNSRIQNTTESTILEFALAHWQNEFNASANGELTVGTFSGTDSEGGILEYNLSTGLGDADNQYFTIDGNLLKFTTTIDYENKNTYNILVSVTDQGGLSLDKNFTISVTNENDPPIITSIYSVSMLGSAEHEISVAENSNYSFDINSSDPDGDSLIFEKSGGADQNLFSLNIATGFFNFTNSPDYESPQDADQNNTFEVWLRAKDGNNSYDEKRLTIHVTDVFENAPPSFQSEGNLTVQENTTFVYEFNATDPNGDALSYSILHGPDASLFNFDQSSGVLTFISPQDFEAPEDNNTDNVYQLTIQVADSVAPVSLNLNIEVTDVFENAPPSFQSEGNLTVQENTTFVYEFNATDPDGDALSYSILHGPDASLFNFDQSSGVLTFISPQDFEAPEDNNTDNVYQLTIQVADSVAPVSLSLNIEVTDEFENAPPSFQSEGNLTVQENTTFVYEFNATDPNGDALSYSILHGPDANLFDLNQASGVLTFISPKDFEAPEDNNTDNVYQLTIQAADSVAPVSLSLNIEVTDEFENAPPSFQSEGNLTVQENTTFVYEFNATDPDGDALSYSILHGPDASLFNFDQSSGVLTFISPKDFEAPEDNNTDNIYQLTIQVADSAAPVSLSLNIEVTDEFENAPPSFQSEGNLTVQENTTFVYEFNATDPNGDALSYSILNGPDASLFDLNQSSGVLTFISPKDFEAPEDNNTDNVYQLTIQVADSVAPVSLNLNIEVTDEFENAPPSFQSEGNLTVSENTTFVYEFNATDPDGDALSYSILHGPDASLFNFDQSSGVLTFISPQDFEAPEDNNTDNVYQLTIQVADSGAPVSLSLNIEVTDEFEGSHSGGEDQSPDGEAQSPEPNIPDSPINKPIVRVDKITRLQNGSYFIRGEILTTGGSSILEVGFILSDSIHFNEPIYFNAQKDDETFFSFTVGDLNQDTTYYYRATASNQSGASYSSIKKFRTPRSVHWDENSTELEAGWMFLDWFGSFLPYHNNWIFHSGLGWVYAISDGSNGLWIWSEEYNWQWTRSGVWPFLFSDQTSNWFYFIKRINGQPIFYDYSDSEYLITPLSSP